MNQLETIDLTDARYALAEYIPEPLLGYLPRVSDWAQLGVEMRLEDARRILALTKQRPDLRPILEAMILNHPCDTFAGYVTRYLKRSIYIGPLWLDYPGMEGHVRALVIRRARRWKDTWTSMPAALFWARYLEGGDEAWKQAAETFRQSEQRHWRKDGPGEHFLRHDLETHGTITPWEGAQINRFLDRYDDIPYLNTAHGGMWWMAPPPDPKRLSDQVLGGLLHQCVMASSAFAGSVWGPEDEAIYHEAFLRLGERGRFCFGSRETTEITAQVAGAVCAS